MWSGDVGCSSSVFQRPWARASSMRVDDWLLEREPAADLVPELVCAWRGTIAKAWVLLPDECVDMFWTDGAMWLSGPETRSRPTTHSNAGTTSAVVGVRFRPAAACALLGVDMSELCDRVVRLDDVCGGRMATRLADRLGSAVDDEARARELETVVRAMRERSYRLNVVGLHVASLLRSARIPTASELGSATGLSQRQLHRHCVASFGYGPAYLLRINRLNRFLWSARRSAASGLAGLASAAGYADQSHLARDVRSIIGTTPKELVHSLAIV